MTDKPLGIRSVTEEGKQLVEGIKNRASELIEMLEDLDNILEAVDRERIIFATAFDFTYQLFEEKAFDFLVNELKHAIISSVEFNYGPFVNRILKALILNYNQGDMIRIDIDSESESIQGVKIDLSGLGDIETYANVVESARSKLGVGNISDPYVASVIWKEKIYGTAREGVRVFKRNKGKIVRFKREFLMGGEESELRYGDVGEEGGEEEDITSRYEGKYEETIFSRLEELPEDQAPYWYIIEHGNSGLMMGSDVGGFAYPVVEPTGFILNAELAIKNAFEQAFIKYKEEAELYLGGLIAENFGLEGFTGSVKDLPRHIKDTIKERLLKDVIVGARETGYRGALGEPIQTAAGKMHLYVTSRGNLKITVQDRAGRWVSPSVLMDL